MYNRTEIEMIVLRQARDERVNRTVRELGYQIRNPEDKPLAYASASH